MGEVCYYHYYEICHFRLAPVYCKLQLYRCFCLLNQMKDVTSHAKIWSCDWLNVCGAAKSEQLCVHQANQFAWSLSSLNSKQLITSQKLVKGNIYVYMWLLIYTMFVQWTCSPVSFHTILLYYCVNVLTAQSHTSALRVEGDSCVLLVLSSGPHPQSTPTSPLFPKLDSTDI